MAWVFAWVFAATACGTGAASDKAANPVESGTPAPPSCEFDGCPQAAMFLVRAGNGEAGGEAGDAAGEAALTLPTVTVLQGNTSFACWRDPAESCAFDCGPSASDGVPGSPYTVSITVPGYRAVTAEGMTTQTCGCPAVAAVQTVALEPDGSPLPLCCADLARDPAHCGSCGNPCTGGSAICSAGLCQP
jgi:hypothetical protein